MTAQRRAPALLIPYENPLKTRLGSDFFRSLPETPGVYVMKDQAGAILYVGKSRNLKSRLQSYRHAAPGRVPSKILRLIHFAHTIEIRTTPDETSALLLENELLRTLKPPYNRQNTRPESYLFLALKFTRLGSETHLRMRLTDQARRKQGDQLYGVFRSRRLLNEAMGAHLRLLWLLQNPDEHFSPPARLLSSRCPPLYSVEISESLIRPIENYWQGTSGELPELISLTLFERSEHSGIPPFLRRTIQEDLDLMKTFFEKGPARNQALKLQHGFKKRLIPQELIDDWIAIDRTSDP